MNKIMNIRPFYYIILVLFSVVLISCEKVDEDITTSDEKHFFDQVDIENGKTQFNIKDTIWFSASFDEKLIDVNSDEEIEIQNQTFIINGLVHLLESQYDSIPFIYQNFDLISDIGDVQLINVINADPAAYSFDIKFGKPLLSNDVRFGLVLNYPGIFGLEYEGFVYFGVDRIDYDDFSTDNEKGYFDLSFNLDEINDSLYYNLPPELRYNYESYYTAQKIGFKKFYFFEAVEE